MKKMLSGLILIFFLTVTVIQAETAKIYSSLDKPSVTIGFSLGSNGGFGGEIHGMVSNLTSESSINLRFAVGYTSLKPGIPADARRIFINDATNGVPEEKGRIYDYKLDFLNPSSFFPWNSHIYM